MKLTHALARHLTALRLDSDLSQRSLADLAGVHPRVVAGLERGDGTLASLEAVAGALGHYVAPYPSALANKRRWLGIGTRSLADAAGISRPTLKALEATGNGRVASYEAMCTALNESPRLAKIEPTWWTPPAITSAVLDALGIKCFDLDPCSPSTPTVPTHRHLTETDGGLWHPWLGTVFCNPPYDDAARWLDKAESEFVAGRASKVVALVPYRPETTMWRRLQSLSADIIVLHDRIRFGGRNYIAPSVSAFVCFGLGPAELSRLSDNLPAHSRLKVVA